MQRILINSFVFTVGLFLLGGRTGNGAAACGTVALYAARTERPATVKSRYEQPGIADAGKSAHDEQSR